MQNIQHLAKFVYIRAEAFRRSYGLPSNYDPQDRITVNGIVHDFLHFQTNLFTNYTDEALLVWIEENLADSALFSIPEVLHYTEPLRDLWVSIDTYEFRLAIKDLIDRNLLSIKLCHH
jgi:hypothetical protein